MTTDETLNAFFAADEAPFADPVFQAGVSEAIARRRMRVSIGLAAAISIALAAVAWSVAPFIDVIVSVGATPGLPAAALVVTLGLLLPRFADRITGRRATRS
ncbi:MAG: hypothetical protein CMF74_02235 [Maricaulis sp.]|jgi:hypothetical protein|nr:hypothetical protein [Maricaulis sp.]HAQ34676.1 hypothetical protein [Alphaproteobacteria bacterium]|tara:strand:- start:500 stop:805 length:306 start_codon:yes stop_codon:yes gene_type:complete